MDVRDRRAVHRVLLDYCDAADRADVTGIVDCFTADAVVDYGPRLHAGGRAALHRLFDRFVSSNEATSHHLSNLRMEGSHDGVVTSTAYVRAWHRLVGGDHLVIMGRYRDQLRRTAAGWRLARRRLEVHGADGPAVGFHRLARSAVRGA